MLPVSLPRLLLAASSGRAAQPQPPGVHLPAGVVTWAAAYGGSAFDHIHTVEATAASGTGKLAPNQLTWQTRNNMPTKRACFGVAALPNGTIYVVGGLTYYGEASAPQIPYIPLDANEEYQVSTNSWRIRAPLPTARAFLGAAAVDGKIYAIGGATDAGTVASVDEYDPLTDTWRPRAPMLTARTHHGVAVSGGKIYAIGGYTDRVEAYDPLTDTWTPRASLPPPARADMGVATGPDGKIYVIGGYDGGTNNRVEAYDPVTDTWQTRAPLPTGRHRLAAVTLINRIYALGGLGDGPGVSATVEVYDPLTDTWQSDTPMPTARASLGAVASGDQLYAIGGWAIAYITFRTVEAATFLHERTWLPLAGW